MTNIHTFLSDLDSILGTDSGDDYSDLENRHQGLKVAYVGADTFHAEGLLANLPFIVSHSGDYATLKVGGEDPIGAPLYFAEKKMASVPLTPEVFEELMDELIPALKRADFLYEFRGKKIVVDGDDLTVTDEVDIYFSWGPDAETARARLEKVSEASVKDGFPAEKQKAIIAAAEIEATPLNKDHRVFPNPEPNFR